MRKIIFGIFVCMMLILSTTTLALTPFRENEQQANHWFFNASPIPLPTSGGWMKTFGGTYPDYGYSVEQTKDGGYIIAAETHSFDVDMGDIWMIKNDDDGNKIWDRTFGGLHWDCRPDVKQTDDNGYIITARTFSFGVFGGNVNNSNVWVLKLDETGTEQWNTTFGREFSDYGSEIQQTTDGGYIIIGSICPYQQSGWHIGLIKIDDLGHKQWNRTFGIYHELGESIRQTNDGGYIVAGCAASPNIYGYRFWLIKTDGKGNEQWNRTYKGTNPPTYAGGNAVEITSDGGYIILGAGWNDETNHSDIWVIKTNQYGDEQWNKTYGGIQDECYGFQIYQTTDGGYIILGNTAGAWMLKIDVSGEEQWSTTYDGKHGGAGRSVDLTSDGGFIITGTTYTTDNAPDVWLIKTDSQGKVKTTSLDNLWLEWLFYRFPNAFAVIRRLVEYQNNLSTSFFCHYSKDMFLKNYCFIIVK